MSVQDTSQIPAPDRTADYCSPGQVLGYFRLEACGGEGNEGDEVLLLLLFHLLAVSRFLFLLESKQEKKER